MRHPDEIPLRLDSPDMDPGSWDQVACARIARELHDGVVQELCYLRFLSQTLAAGALSETERQQLLRQITAQTDRALFAVRSTLDELCPHELTQRGLQHAVKQFTERLELESGLLIELEGRLDVALAERPAWDVYRVIQEALRNVVKHAHTDQARVRIRVQHRQLMGRIVDGGRGCQRCHANHAPRRLGIRHMRARIRALGGSFKIWSRPNIGTIVQFNVPLCH